MTTFYEFSIDSSGIYFFAIYWSFSMKNRAEWSYYYYLNMKIITICLLDESNQTTTLIIMSRSRSTSQSLTMSTRATMRTAMRSVNETISNVLRRRNSIDIECRSIIFNSLFHRFCSCKRYVSYLSLLSRVFEEFEDIIVFWHLNLAFSSSSSLSFSNHVIFVFVNENFFTH